MTTPRATYQPFTREGARLLVYLALVVGLILASQATGLGWDTLDTLLFGLGVWQAAELPARVTRPLWERALGPDTP